MRIAGISLSDNKQIKYALTAVYGIGVSRAQKILKAAGVNPVTQTVQLSQDEEQAIRKVLEGYMLEGDLKREISGNVKRLKDINSYRGGRHARRLPLRGQRTKTNSRTVRGNVRKTMASGKKKVDLK